MNIQRYLLLIALFVIGYMMIYQWNQDYGQTPLTEPDQVSSQQVMQTADIPDMSTGDLADDLPQAVPGTDRQVVASDAVETASNGLISVETDSLLVRINPLGGDIVSLSLPGYPQRKDRPDLPFQLLSENAERTYVAMSGLIGSDGLDARASGRPLFTSSSSEYRLADGEQQLVVDLHYSAEQINYVKRFTFTRGDFLVGVEYIIDNQSDRTWNGALFGQIKRDDSRDPSSTGATGMATYLGGAYWSEDGSYTKLTVKDMQKANLSTSVEGGWLAWLQHYFVSAWIPSAEQTHKYSSRQDRQGNYILSFVSPEVRVAAGEQAVLRADFYGGPKIQSRLKEISQGLELTVDYGFLWWIAQPLFWVLSIIHSFVGNWGWSIILLTVLIKLVFFPLSATSYRSMANMRRVGPKLQALREQFGDDRQKMSQAMMELYKKEKINPLGGCLPILVQMPVFIALYWVLMESVEMRQAEWMFWITDLSLKDPYFVLPILMGASMFVQQMLNPTPPDPMQARVMKMLPLIFTVFFLWFPSGLVLYWVVNNVLSIGQQWYITRQIEGAAAKKD